MIRVLLRCVHEIHIFDDALNASVEDGSQPSFETPDARHTAAFGTLYYVNRKAFGSHFCIIFIVLV